jgi:hypothetical protein
MLKYSTSPNIAFSGTGNPAPIFPLRGIIFVIKEES